MFPSLAGRLAVVSGAGSGIGQAVALKLSENKCKVGLFDLSQKGLEKTESTIAASGGECKSIIGDISKRDDVQHAVDTAASHFKSVPTIGINCAGMTNDSMLLKMTDEQWQSILSCHLTGTFLFTQILASKMVESREKGSIVNTGSISGKLGNTGQANYSAAKAGVIAFSKTAARELATKGIRCNTIVPGFINTPMAAAVPPHVKQMVLMMTPMGRFGETAEISDVYCFLASESSSYITGVDLEVAGGLYM